MSASFNMPRSARPKRWMDGPVIDGQAVVVSRRPRSPERFSSEARPDTSGHPRTGDPADGQRQRPRRRVGRTLLWTAPAGLAIATALFALAFLAAPDRPVAEPMTPGELIQRADLR